MITGLLLIDIQNDYFPNGNCELYKSEETVDNIQKVLTYFRLSKMPVIHVQHINTRPEASYFLPGTKGVEIHKKLTPQKEEVVITKHVPNSFYETNLLDMIKKKGIEQLVICGMMTHMCIDTTVRACKDHSIPVTLLKDTCTTKALKTGNHEISAEIVQDVFMASLNGMFANVISSEEFLVELR